jgi:hypothetical protein
MNELADFPVIYGPFTTIRMMKQRVGMQYEKSDVIWHLWHLPLYDNKSGNALVSKLKSG